MSKPSMTHELRPWLLAMLLASASGTVLADARAGQDTAPVLDSALALETFDAVWNLVNNSAYDVGRSGLDWQQVRERYRPKVAALEDQHSLRHLLQDMLDQIGESHFSILPAAVMALAPEQGEGRARHDIGMQVRLLDGSARITFVETDSPAAKAGLRPGWELLAVDGFTLAEALTAYEALTDSARLQAQASMQLGLQSRLSERRSEEEIKLQVRDLQGNERSASISPVPARGEWVTAPMLPPTLLDVSIEARASDQGSCTGYIRFNAWLPVVGERLTAAMPTLESCAGMVIDLRGNPGGIMAVMMPLAGNFFTEPSTLGTLRTPDSTFNFLAFPRRVTADGTLVRPYTGPVAILMDGLSMSTSEMFASGMQALGRAQVFGHASPGMALPSQVSRLPNGDSLLYAFAEYTNPAEQRIEGLGVIPDHVVSLEPGTQSVGDDAVMAAAVAWIHKQ